MLNYVFLMDPTPVQIKQITQLYRNERWWTDPADDPPLIRRMVEGSHCFIVATHGDEIIGMGRAISDRASDAYIQDVTVADAYRGQGIGKQIVKALVDRLHHDGVGWIGLIAERGSHEFYQKLGFKKMQNAEPMLKFSW